MCLLFLSEADPLGIGTLSCGYRQGGGVFWHDGLASVWESDRLHCEDQGRDCSTTGSPKMCKGFMYGSVLHWFRPLPRELDHPTTLGIGGIGRDTVSVGVSQLLLC